MSSSNSPCAACKFLRRKCTQECVFAPYFPPDQPVKFANVHKVFGASNVAKILNELNASQREDAVNSLAYEAEARLRDPVYGCVGLISILQTRLKQVQTDLLIAKQELCTYIGGQSPAMLPCLNPGFIQQYQNMLPSPATVAAMGSGGPGMHPNLQQMLTLQGPGNLRDAHHQQQQLYEAHQRQMVEAAAREQEMLRNLEHQQRVQQQQLQQQHQSADLMRFNSGFDAAGPSGQPPVNPNGSSNSTTGSRSRSMNSIINYSTRTTNNHRMNTINNYSSSLITSCFNSNLSHSHSHRSNQRRNHIMETGARRVVRRADVENQIFFHSIVRQQSFLFSHTGL
ncbi:unnamed protein product [Lactuca virosa]|uniref:LOB domain-containing protein n=1 Tax=Lactuca virosa TaxID=75947 RepID=A0AAU9M2Z0_9ASTR|nr:unnamed protein product [Lactuca virosa]